MASARTAASRRSCVAASGRDRGPWRPFMALNTQQRCDRLRVRLEELKDWRAREGVSVQGWTIDGVPIGLGGAWPDRKGVHRFAATAEVPEHWPLEETR